MGTAVGAGSIRLRQAQIGLAWVLTPVLSGAIAAVVYGVVRGVILRGHPQAFQAWLPWLSVVLVLSFGALVGPVLVAQVGMGVQRFWGITVAPRLLLLGLIGLGALGITALGVVRLRRGAGLLWGPVEAGFALLQVVSAGLVAFAHGANDVGNAIAPLAAIVQLLHSPEGLSSGDLNLPFWVLLLGGGGIVLGLAVLGGPVMATVGTGLLALQPSQGFCAEWATALTVLLASRLGLPVSTSNALVGALVGVGLVRGEGVRWRRLGRIGAVWVLTVPGAMAIAIAIFWALGYLLF